MSVLLSLILALQVSADWRCDENDKNLWRCQPAKPATDRRERMQPLPSTDESEEAAAAEIAAAVAAARRQALEEPAPVLDEEQTQSDAASEAGNEIAAETGAVAPVLADSGPETAPAPEASAPAAPVTVPPAPAVEPVAEAAGVSIAALRENYVLQVGAYRDRASALANAAEIDADRIEIAPILRDQEEWYLLLYGGYASYAEAQAAGEQFARDYPRESHWARNSAGLRKTLRSDR